MQTVQSSPPLDYFAQPVRKRKHKTEPEQPFIHKKEEEHETKESKN
jgi:hypothetical protein